MLIHVHAGVSVHQYSSRAGLWDLCGSADPPGNLDWSVSGGPSPAGQTAIWSCQEHETPVGGKNGVKAAGKLASQSYFTGKVVFFLIEFFFTDLQKIKKDF